MYSESSGVVEFDLGPLVQGQMRIAKLKSAYNSFIIGPRGLGWYTNNPKELLSCIGPKSFFSISVGPTYRKSWAGNFLVWSDLTLGLSFKVKQA